MGLTRVVASNERAQVARCPERARARAVRPSATWLDVVCDYVALLQLFNHFKILASLSTGLFVCVLLLASMKIMNLSSGEICFEEEL